MSKLGYTWYPENWWTSDQFFEWEDFPLVRYAYREVLDLLYSKKGSAKVSKSIIKSRFRIELNDKEYEMLKSVFDISEDDFWSSTKVKKRMSRAEASRENGKKGGAKKGNQNARKTEKKTTQEPRITTQKNNPNNPPLEIEREKEKEIKIENKDEVNDNSDNNEFELVDDLLEKYLSNVRLVEAVLDNPKKINLEIKQIWKLD